MSDPMIIPPFSAVNVRLPYRSSGPCPTMDKSRFARQEGSGEAAPVVGVARVSIVPHVSFIIALLRLPLAVTLTERRALELYAVGAVDQPLIPHISAMISPNYLGALIGPGSRPKAARREGPVPASAGR